MAGFFAAGFFAAGFFAAGLFAAGFFHGAPAFFLWGRFVSHRRTKVFTEATTPRGLLADHTTKRGVWGRIVVLEGSLRYVIPSLDHVEVLSPEREGTVVPELPHHLEHTDRARFYVELFRAPEA